MSFLRINYHLLLFFVIYARFFTLNDIFLSISPFYTRLFKVEVRFMRAISNYINSIPDLSKTDKARLTYIISCIIYEGSKILLFLAFFFCIHKLDGFIYSLIILLPLRIISGGLHFKHYTACLLFSFLYFYVVNVLLMPFRLPLTISFILLTVCAVINYKIGPITSNSRPQLQPEEIRKGKLNIFIATCYDLILTILFFDSAISTVGFWTIVLHTLQLVLAFWKKKRGEICVQKD